MKTEEKEYYEMIIKLLREIREDLEGCLKERSDKDEEEI